MNFKIQKIRKEPSPLKKKIDCILSFKFISIILLFALLFIGGAYTIQRIPLEDVAKRIFPQNILIKKNEQGHTNFLLLGVGGKTEQGGYLSDSMMVVSLDINKGTVSMLSLPRDLYTESEMGSRKINEIYALARSKYGEEKALKIIKRAISGFMNLEIHYAGVVNFEVFSSFVDILGGVQIFVPEEIVDPYYPAKNYGYQTFVIRKGVQKIDGETALKYARSRKTTSDYSRAQRQQRLLLAIKEKAEAENILLNTKKIRKLYDTFIDNVNMDLKFKEILILANAIRNINNYRFVSAVLNDDDNKQGGFLYAPAQEFYGGRFILLPYSLRDTQKFIHLLLFQPEVFLENTQVRILNGSFIEGLAGDLALRLRRFGFHIADVANYELEGEPIFKSFYQKVSNKKTTKTQNFIENYLGVPQKNIPKILQKEKESEELITDLEIILGVTHGDL